MQVQRFIVTMPKSKRTSYFPHISIIGKVLNCMAIIQIYFFCVFIDTNNKSTQKDRLSETTHLGAQNQLYKQVDIVFFTNITMFFKKLNSNIACCSNAANSAQLPQLRRLVTGTTDAI